MSVGGHQVILNLSKYNMHNLINYLSIHRTDLNTMANKAVAEKIETLDFEDKKYSFTTYEVNSENLRIVKQKLIEKFGSIAEYAKYSGLNQYFLYNLLSGGKKPGIKAWSRISYDADFVKYNQKEQQKTR